MLHYKPLTNASPVLRYEYFSSHCYGMNTGGRSIIKRQCPSRRVSAAAQWLVLLLLARLGGSVVANPVGATVARGSASLTHSGSRLNIQVSQGAVLNWRSFNIKPGETTTFQQPSASSVVWNRIFDPNLSQIWGNLNANGWVVLMN